MLAIAAPFSFELGNNSIGLQKPTSFWLIGLLRYAMLARYIGLCYCCDPVLFVCVSDITRYSIKTAKSRKTAAQYPRNMDLCPQRTNERTLGTLLCDTKDLGVITIASP